MSINVRSWAWGLPLLVSTLACERTHDAEPSPAPSIVAQSTALTARPSAKGPSLDVSLAYPATESIGAKKRVHLEKTSSADAFSPPDAWKIDFEKSGGFGGICWKNKVGNEGEAPGDDLSSGGYRRLSFRARGAVGGEVVEFRAGGLGHIKTRYRDSFDVTAGKIRLTPSWNEYAIYVNDVDLSSVMTPFCALFHREDNAEHTVIFLDDIRYGD